VPLTLEKPWECDLEKEEALMIVIIALRRFAHRTNETPICPFKLPTRLRSKGSLLDSAGKRSWGMEPLLRKWIFEIGCDAHRHTGHPESRARRARVLGSVSELESWVSPVVSELCRPGLEAWITVKERGPTRSSSGTSSDDVWSWGEPGVGALGDALLVDTKRT
jgi:hypothetical protein